MMSPSELRLWTAVVRRAGEVTPDMAAKILAAFQILRDSMTDAEFTKAVDTGYAEQVVAQLLADARWNAAMQPVRDVIRQSLVRGVSYYARNIPVPPSQTKQLLVAFDYLSPHVVTAIRQLETRVLTSLEDATKETVRAIVENGLRDGANPRAAARDLRSLIGLGPTQLQEVENFREALSGANGRSVTDYALRNRTVDRLLAKGALTPEQIDRYTEVYRKRRVAQNAETVARTAALDAQRLANRLAWESAADQGIVDRSRLTKTWRGVMDSRERDTHVAMEGATVPFDALWPVDGGAMTPGDGAYNCRCIAVYRVAIAA